MGKSDAAAWWVVFTRSSVTTCDTMRHAGLARAVRSWGSSCCGASRPRQRAFCLLMLATASRDGK